MHSNNIKANTNIINYIVVSVHERAMIHVFKNVHSCN